MRSVTEQILPQQDALSTCLWTVPYPRHPFFTGQERLLAQLARMLQSQCSAVLTQPQAITGLGGISKTQVAVEYAWRYRQEYQTVLWSRADTREALFSGYAAFARHLGLPEKEENDQMIILRAVLYAQEGRYTEAEPLYQRALTIAEQELGPQRSPQGGIVFSAIGPVRRTVPRYGWPNSSDLHGLPYID